MSDLFANALGAVLRSEGGYSDNPNDPGGETNFGITHATYAAWRRQHGEPQQSVKFISHDEVAAIYRANYWNAVQGDHLPSGVSYVVFDGAVNSGVNRSGKWLQSVVGLSPDGQIGPKTLSGVARFVTAFGANKLIDEICDERLAFLKSLPTWKHFGNGWEKRVASVHAQGRLWTVA